MNVIIQNILVFSALGIAVWFLLKKFVIPGKVKTKKNCGSSDCGCH